MEFSINGESVQIDLVSKETPLREYIKTKVTAPGREVWHVSVYCTLSLNLGFSLVANPLCTPTFCMIQSLPHC